MPKLKLFISKIFDRVVQSLPHKAVWLRWVITEAAQRELIKDGES